MEIAERDTMAATLKTTIESFAQKQFRERDYAGALQFLTADVSIFGITGVATAPNKAEAAQLLEDEAAGIPEGNGVHLFHYREKWMSQDCAIVTVIVSISQDWSCSGWQCRMSAACVRQAGNFLISTLHISIPAEKKMRAASQPVPASGLTSGLTASEADIETIINNMPGGMHRCRLFPPLYADYLSPGFCKICGYSLEEFFAIFKGKYIDLLVDEDRESFMDAVRECSQAPGFRVLEYRIRCKDGSIKYITDHFRSLIMPDGRIWGFGATLDITRQKESFYQLKLLTDSIPGGLISYAVEDGKITVSYASDGLAAMLGYSQEEFRQAMAANAFTAIADEDKKRICELLMALADGRLNEASITCQAQRKDGSIIWGSVHAAAFMRSEGKAVINSVITDITEQKAAELKLLKISKTDGMTGLYNRVSAEKIIRERLSETRTAACALIMADIDGLKYINDTFGHPEGDKVIKTVACLLASHFRKGDVIGRAGGDEFMIFMDPCGDSKSVPRRLTEFFAKLHEASAAHGAIEFSCSLGAAIQKPGTANFQALYKKADTALYQAKSRGKNNFCIFGDTDTDADMNLK